jgi:hypothetical protein
MKTKLRRKPVSEAERSHIVQEVRAYSAEHGVSLVAALKATHPSLSDKTFYNWHNRSPKTAPEPAPPTNGETTHFPLALIPEKPPAKKAHGAKPVRARDDDKEIAAQLLDVAARLLRR